MLKRLHIAEKQLSQRPFSGVGVQVDCFLYDEINQEAGVTAEDLVLYEQRLAALRPGAARVFVAISDFNPSFDARTYDWQRPGFRRQVAGLKRLDTLGISVNLCMSPWTNNEMRQKGMEVTAVDLVEHLVRAEGLTNIRWLTLFNEPDSLYHHDSPLYTRLFGEQARENRSPWSAYVAKHKHAQKLLVERQFYPAIKLIVSDTVWGYAMRQERMAMAVRDFAGMDVSYACHNYIVDWPGFYDGSPDFVSPGMAEESRIFRDMVGDDAELIIWEFNNAGVGFSNAFPGVNRYGEDLLGTVDNGVAVSRKILEALGNGMDGIALWCLCDMFYNWPHKKGLMRFGLWRYRTEGWEPRPYYYYVAALMHSLRPGATLHTVEGLGDGLAGLAARSDQGWHVVVLNLTNVESGIQLRLPETSTAIRLRIYPGTFPTQNRLPIDTWQLQETTDGVAAITLNPKELTVLSIDNLIEAKLNEHVV
jgi:hypothetical protein